MKYFRYAGGLILILFMMSGCGGGESNGPGKTNSETNAKESVFDPMVQTIDKARMVEGLSANRTQEIDKELEKSQ